MIKRLLAIGRTEYVNSAFMESFLYKYFDFRVIVLNDFLKGKLENINKSFKLISWRN